MILVYQWREPHEENLISCSSTK